MAKPAAAAAPVNRVLDSRRRTSSPTQGRHQEVPRGAARRRTATPLPNNTAAMAASIQDRPARPSASHSSLRNSRVAPTTNEAPRYPAISPKRRRRPSGRGGSGSRPHSVTTASACTRSSTPRSTRRSRTAVSRVASISMRSAAGACVGNAAGIVGAGTDLISCSRGRADPSPDSSTLGPLETPSISPGSIAAAALKQSPGTQTGRRPKPQDRESSASNELAEVADHRWECWTGTSHGGGIGGHGRRRLQAPDRPSGMRRSMAAPGTIDG